MYIESKVIKETKRCNMNRLSICNCLSFISLPIESRAELYLSVIA
jgi:hypothetical protein